MHRIAAAILACASLACSGRHITGTTDISDEDAHEIVEIDLDPDIAEPDAPGPDVVDVEDASEEEPACDAPADPYAACAETGGTVHFPLCCEGVADFPETCFSDPCGCPEIESHNVAACDCGSGRCWDGRCCVDAP